MAQIIQSSETLLKLAEIFSQISIGEAEIENFRYSLTKCSDFDPYSAFKALDHLNLGSLSSTEFQSFLEKRRVFCTNDEAFLLVRQYDSNLNGRLSFQEFINFVLPSTNPGFRDLALNRHAAMTSEVEHLLGKLVEREVVFHRNLEALRREIILKPDFNLVQTFRCVDLKSRGGIDRDDLIRFVRGFFLIYDHDVDAIFRRVDNDADGFLSYKEFADCVMPSRTFVDSERIEIQQGNVRSVRNSSPLRNPQRCYRSVSPAGVVFARSFMGNQCNGIKEFQNSEGFNGKTVSFREPVDSRIQTGGISNYQFGRSNVRPSFKTYSSKSLHSSKSPMKPSKASQEITTKSSQFFRESINHSNPNPIRPSPNSDLQDFIPVLQDHIKQSRQIESLKNTLALRHDFNLNEIFKKFDKYDVGILSLSDLDSTLKSFSFTADAEDLQLLMKNVSHLQDNRWRSSDFSDLFTPKSEEYSRILKSRSLNTRQGELSKESLAIFLHLFELLLEKEALSEKHRQRLSKIQSFNAFSTFNALDKDRNGYITSMEFAEMLKQFSVPFNLKDLHAVMDKFDKNNDGRVSYSEFVEEVSPKSNHSY
jgi:Ca2+-binding EF-hand superfamily protein